MKQPFLTSFKKTPSTEKREKKSAVANGILLFFTIITIFISPILPNKHLDFFYTCSITSIIIFAVLSLKKSYKIVRIFAVFTSLFTWISFFIDMPFFKLSFRFINFIFFLFLIFNLVRQISSITTVTFKVIVNSITGYLLLGFAFSLIVTVISLNIPNAYNINTVQNLEFDFLNPLQNNIYYTFMTFTTTGYGDIIPTHPLSKSLAILISVAGQLYVTIIIAILVGKYVSVKEPESPLKQE